MTEVRVGTKVELHVRQVEGQDRLRTWIKCSSSGPLTLVFKVVTFFSQEVPLKILIKFS